jgi:hypothetical protein
MTDAQIADWLDRVQQAGSGPRFRTRRDLIAYAQRFAARARAGETWAFPPWTVSVDQVLED